MIDAIVLAGGSAKDLDGAPAKGLVPINGRPMFEYVINALDRCEGIGRVCIMLPVEYLLNGTSGKAEVVVTGGDLPDVIKAGIDFLSTKNPVLILSADIPLVTPEAINDFLERCEGFEAELYYPIISHDEVEKRFPGVERTYVRLKEGRFTGGNAILVDPKFVAKNMENIKRIYELRKKPLAIARELGFSFLISFMLGSLTIGQLEERIGKLTRSVCVGVITPFAEIGVDVDKESDLQLAVMALAGG